MLCRDILRHRRNTLILLIDRITDQVNCDSQIIRLFVVNFQFAKILVSITSETRRLSSIWHFSPDIKEYRKVCRSSSLRRSISLTGGSFVHKTESYEFISSTTSAGFTVISTHAGIKPLLAAFLADLMFDHAEQ